MQFREVGHRVQCYVAWYDSASRRTRQRMIYSFSKAAPKKPSSGDLRPDFGTLEQRRKWAGTICMEIFTRAVRQGAADPASLPSKLNDIAMTVVMQFQTAPPPFTPQQVEHMRTSIRPLAQLLGIRVYNSEAKDSQHAEDRNRTE